MKVNNEKGAFVKNVNLKPPGEFPGNQISTEDSFAVQTLQFVFKLHFLLWTHSEMVECTNQCLVLSKQVPSSCSVNPLL